MGVRSVEFLGKNFRSPGSRGAFLAKPQPRSVSEELATLILIGSSDNGWYVNDDTLTLDKRVMDFGSQSEAKAILGGGNLLEAITQAFNPSSDVRFRSGPQLIKALCVSNNTHASVNVPSVLASVTKTIRSIVPGPRGNSYRLRVSNGGTLIEIGDSSNITQSSPLDGDEFQISYSGNATTAILSFNGTTLSVLLTGQSDGSQNLSLTVKDYPTIGELVDGINSKVGYSAILISQADNRTDKLDDILPAEIIDLKVAARVCQSLLYRQELFLRGNGLVEISDTNGRKPIQDMLIFSYLAGGATANPTTQDYLDALKFIEDEEIPGFYLAVCTPIEAVHAVLADTLDRLNSLDGRLEKYGACGLSKNDSIADRITKIKAINSEFITCGFSPVTLRSENSIDILDFDGWMIGVIALAIKAAANVRETPTYKDLNVLAVPERKLTRTELNKVLAVGGLVVDRKPQGGAFKINRALSTYQNTNLILNEVSLTCTALALVKDLRESLEAFVGEVPTDPNTIGASITSTDLRQFVDDLIDNRYVRRLGWVTSNPFTGEDAIDKNYTIQQDGDTIFFLFPNGNLVTPLNFIFSLLKLDVVRGSATA